MVVAALLPVGETVKKNIDKWMGNEKGMIETDVIS